MTKQIFKNEVTKKYYSQVKHLFPILSKQEKRFLQFFSEHLKNYELTHLNPQYNDLISYFGEPEDIISAYYEHIESKFIINHMRFRKIIKRTSFIFIAGVIVISTYFVYTIYRAFNEFKDSQIYSEQIIIQEIDETIEE